MKKVFFPLLFQVILVACLVIPLSCDSPKPLTDLTSDVDSIVKKWVPDKREGIFDATLNHIAGKAVLKGETNIPEAKKELVGFLKGKNLEFYDSLTVLPDTGNVKLPWGLINVSVCNMRSEPSHGAEMISQALMGTPVKIFKQRGGWYLIQTPDKYLGWTDGDAVEAISNQEHERWKKSTRAIFLDKYGDIFSGPDNNQVVSDITAGGIVEITGKTGAYLKLRLPDGREGVGKDGIFFPFNDWAAAARPEAENLLNTSFRFMGTPYLWGGTSPKGLDCSGFVKTSFFLNGLILARDVSLQIRHGMVINDFKILDSLKKGDLLFFGSVRNGKTRATHVGMYIGNTEFIHESGLVRVNSLDSTRANFSRYRRNTFIGARRVLGHYPGEGLNLVSEHPWYK